MKKLDICSKCEKFHRTHAYYMDGKRKIDLNNVFTCGINEPFTIDYSEEEFIQSDIPENCPYILEQSI